MRFDFGYNLNPPAFPGQKTVNNVTVFDPDVAGSDFTPTTIAGPATASVGTATGYTTAKPGFAGTFEWRSLRSVAGKDRPAS